MKRFILAVIALTWASALAQAAYLQAATYAPATDPSGPYTSGANPFTIATTGTGTAMVNTVGGLITQLASGQYRDSSSQSCTISSAQTFSFKHNATAQWLVGDTFAHGCGTESGGNPLCTPGTGNPFCVVASATRPSNAIARLYNPGYLSSTDCIAVSDGSTTAYSSWGGKTAPSNGGTTCPQGAYYPFLKLMPVPGTMTLCATFSGTQECVTDNGTVDAATPNGIIVSGISETNGSAVITRASGSFITDGVKAGMIVAGTVGSIDAGLFVQSVDSATQITMSGISTCSTCTGLTKGFGVGGVWFGSSAHINGGAVRLYLTQEYGDPYPLERQGAYYFQTSTAPDAGTQVTLSYQYGWAPSNNAGNLTSAIAPNFISGNTRSASYLLPSVDSSTDRANTVAAVPVAGSLPGSGIAFLDSTVSYGIPAGITPATPCLNPTLSCKSDGSQGNMNPSFTSGNCPGWTGGAWSYTYIAGPTGYNAGFLQITSAGTTICGADLASTSGRIYTNGKDNVVIKWNKIDYTLTGNSAYGISATATNNLTILQNEVYTAPTLAEYAAMADGSPGSGTVTQPQSCIVFSAQTGLTVSGNYLHGCFADGMDPAGGNGTDNPSYTNNVVINVGYSLLTHADVFQWTCCGTNMENFQITGNFHGGWGFLNDPAAFPSYSSFPNNLQDVNGSVYINGGATTSCSGGQFSNDNISTNFLDGGNGLVVSILGGGTSVGCGDKVNITSASISGSVLTTASAITLSNLPATLSCPSCTVGTTITGSVGGTGTDTQWNLNTTYGSPINNQQMYTGLGYQVGWTMSSNFIGKNTNGAPTKYPTLTPLTETGNRTPDSGGVYATGTPF